MSRSAPASPATIYVACPWGPHGGGMFKVADYLIQAQADPRAPAAGTARLAPLDTRGSGPAWASAFMLLRALALILGGRLSGRLAGVHVNMAERLSLVRKCVVVVACRAIGMPVVLHLHAAQLHHMVRKLPRPAQALVRWSFGRADHCVVLGEVARRFVVTELGVPAQRVEVVINGVPEPAFARRAAPAAGTPRRLFFLGNLGERKGVSDLLRALAQSRLVATGQVELVLAGGGDVAHYQALAAELGVQQAARFVGWADQAQAGQWMAGADALILPSYDEGLPLVILEALANGVAVICTPVGEIPDVLHDGEQALFVTPGDSAGIAAAIDRLLADDGLRQHLEHQGRAVYERQFSLQKFAGSIAAVHRRVFGTCAALPGAAAGGVVPAQALPRATP